VSITSTFYAQLLRPYFCAKNYKARAMLRKALSYEKFSSKMLMKLTPDKRNKMAFSQLTKTRERKDFAEIGKNEHFSSKTFSFT